MPKEPPLTPEEVEERSIAQRKRKAEWRKTAKKIASVRKAAPDHWSIGHSSAAPDAVDLEGAAMWAASNIGNLVVQKKDAPSGLAWWMLEQSKTSETAQKKLLETVFKRLEAAKRAGSDKFLDDGSSTLEIIDEIANGWKPAKRPISTATGTPAAGDGGCVCPVVPDQNPETPTPGGTPCPSSTESPTAP